MLERQIRKDGDDTRPLLFGAFIRPLLCCFNDAIMASTDDYLIKSDSGEWCSLITLIISKDASS